MLHRSMFCTSLTFPKCRACQIVLYEFVQEHKTVKNFVSDKYPNILENWFYSKDSYFSFFESCKENVKY